MIVTAGRPIIPVEIASPATMLYIASLVLGMLALFVGLMVAEMRGKLGG